MTSYDQSFKDQVITALLNQNFIFFGGVPRSYVTICKYMNIYERRFREQGKTVIMNKLRDPTYDPETYLDRNYTTNDLDCICTIEQFTRFKSMYKSAGYYCKINRKHLTYPLEGIDVEEDVFMPYHIVIQQDGDNTIGVSVDLFVCDPTIIKNVLTVLWNNRDFDCNTLLLYRSVETDRVILSCANRNDPFFLRITDSITMKIIRSHHSGIPTRYSYRFVKMINKGYNIEVLYLFPYSEHPDMSVFLSKKDNHYIHDCTICQSANRNYMSNNLYIAISGQNMHFMCWLQACARAYEVITNERINEIDDFGWHHYHLPPVVEQEAPEISTDQETSTYGEVQQHECHEDINVDPGIENLPNSTTDNFSTDTLVIANASIVTVTLDDLTQEEEEEEEEEEHANVTVELGNVDTFYLTLIKPTIVECIQFYNDCIRNNLE